MNKGGELHSFKCDVSDERSVQEAFQWINITFTEPPSILINNAGISKFTQIFQHDKSEALMDVLNTNFLGFLFCTREAMKLIKKSDDDAIIINIGSILGHSIPFVLGRQPIWNVYPGTKHGIRATIEVMRQELIYLKNTNIRISVSKNN